MRLPLAVLAAITILGCSAGPGAATPDPGKVLRDSGRAMAAVKSVAADVKFGPGIVLQGLTLSSATAKIQLPGDSDTLFKVKQGDFLVDVRVVTTQGHAYLRLPFSKFTEITPEQASAIPDLSKLFDPSQGLPAVLPAGRGARYAGQEQVAGVDCDKLTTTYTAAQVGQLLGGHSPAGDVHSTLWAARSDHLLRRVILAGELVQPGQRVQVQVELHDFNQPVTISPPV